MSNKDAPMARLAKAALRCADNLETEIATPHNGRESYTSAVARYSRYLEDINELRRLCQQAGVHL